MEQKTCQKVIKPTSFTEGQEKRKCGKIATHIWGGLPFCEHHYNSCLKHLIHQSQPHNNKLK